MPLDRSVLAPEDTGTSNSNLDDLIKAEGAEHLKPVITALYAQESGSGKNSKTSVDGARGPMQIMPGTFKQLAREGESIDNETDNLRVGIRLVKALGDRFNNDPARIAAGYFSGEGNVNPTGDQIIRKDKADGNGKKVSAYVQDVLNRIVPSAQAEESGTAVAKSIAKGGSDNGLDIARQIAAGGGGSDGLAVAREIAGTQAAAAPADKPTTSLLDDVKKAVGWREGEKFKRPEGMTADTFSAGVPDAQKAPTSVMDGYKTDTAAPSKNVVGMTAAGEAKLRGQLQGATDEKLAKYVDQGGLTGQVAARLLEERGVYRDKVQSGQVPTQAEDMQAGVDPKRMNQERRQDANREYLQRNKGAVMDYLIKAQRLAPEDAELTYKDMLAKGVVPNQAGMDNTRQEAGYGDVLATGAKRAVAGMGRGYMGLGEWLGDAFGIKDLSKFSAAAASGYEADFKAAADDVVGKIPQQGFKALVAETAPSIISQLPGVMGAGLAMAFTKNPAVMESLLSTALLTPMGAQVFGETYRDGKASGLSLTDNTIYSAGKAMAEVLPERLSLGALFKVMGGATQGSARQLATAILGQQATEHATEQVTTVAQFLLDKAYTQPNLSLKDLQQQMIDTFKATALQAPILAAVGTGAAVAGKGASALRDKMDPTGAMARQLDRDVSGAEFNQDAIDRAVRLQMDPNADGNTEVLPEAKGFAPTPAPSATAQPEAAGQQPVAVAPNEDPLGDAPLTSPIADELASLEGTPAEEPKVGGTPVSQHTPESLQFLMNAHPDQIVRDQAAQVLQQKQAAAATYPVVTQTENGPVESKIDSALKGQIDDDTVHSLATATNAGQITLLAPASAGRFTGGMGGVATPAESFAQLINAISGRNVIVAQGVTFRGAIADERNLILNQEQGAEGLTSVAFHELRHALADDHPDLSAFWREAVQQHLDTSDSALLHFLTHKYQDPAASPERVKAMRDKGRTDSQILNAILSKHATAQAYEETGRGSRRDWVLEELEADALGDAANRDGVIHKALDYMAKVDIGLVKQFAQFVQGVLKRLGKGFGSEGFVKGSTEAEIKARLEALDKAAAEVLGKYASRTQNQKRMQAATPAELLLIKKSHPDDVVRDMASAELKKRETEAAYAQREEQKAGEKENFKQANAQARLDQAEAEAKAAGTDDGTPTAMAQAMAGMKKDIQALRRQLAKEMKKAAATARGNAQVRQATLEDNEAGRFSPKREAADQTLPTRWPASKRLTPSVNDPMLADLATLRETPKQFEQAVNALAEEPGMRTRARSTEGKLDAVLDKMTSNLLWLHDMVPAEIRERSKLWYDGANTIANNWAKTYGKTRSQTAGILAVLSPQKDWFMNVTMAERVLDILSSQMDHPFDAKMRGAAFKFLVKDFAKAEDKRDNLKAFDAVKGKTLKEAVEAGDLRQAGIWLRAYDEAYHDPRHAVIHPEGDFGDNARTVTGTETLRAWGDFNALGKAASIFLDGRAENINAQLGGEHKVRNFYNNIYAPKDERFATIDTHAVAADLLRPLAGADKPVADNFGASGGSDLTGVSGTYPIHLEAYRRAAEARGVLPREMQSITWEAVRGLFTEGFKGKKDNLKAIDNVWREVDKGKLTTAEARAKILEMAGGMEHPDWWNGQEPQSEGKAKSYSQKRPAFTGNKIVFEVAPDPHDTQLTQRWNALPEDLKGRISYDIAWDTAGKLLGFYNSDTIKGELHTQVGGYLEDTNPSFSLWMNKYAPMVKVQEIANVLGYVLKQDSMVIGSPKKFKGGTEMGMVVVRGVSDTNAKKVYDELRNAIRAEDGSALINGHTTAENAMSILVDLGTQVQIAQRVAEQLGDRHDVYDSTTFVQWPERGENEYGLSGKQEDNGSGPEPSLREYAHQLRSEASAELERRIAGRFSPAREGRDGAAGLPPEFGQARPGAVSVRGVHYSGQSRDRLSSNFFGTGLKGAEASRLADPANADLRQRLYFYVDEGKGVFPEQGVGSRAHDVQLNNLYDLKADPLRLRRDNSGDPSGMERAIMKAGFDGYYAPEIFTRQGAVVLIGNHSVPVRQLNQDEAPRFSPSRQSDLFEGEFATKKTTISREIVVSSKGAKETIKLGNVTSDGQQIAPTKQALENFWDWFGESETTDSAGRPIRYFHATKADFSVFEANRPTVNSGTFGEWETSRAAIFFTDSLEDSQAYGTSDGKFKDGANVMPVFIKAEKILDFTPGFLRSSVADEFDSIGFNSRWLERFDWSKFDDEEGRDFVAAAKQLGYDAVAFWDDNPDTGNEFKALAVFSPEQIKSAIGNLGTFDSRNPDIKFSPSRRFYSQLQRSFEQAPDRVFGPAAQVKAWLAGNAAKLGIKQDEIQWTGINEWLDLQGKNKVSKQQVLDYLAANGVQVEEVEKGAAVDPGRVVLRRGDDGMLEVLLDDAVYGRYSDARDASSAVDRALADANSEQTKYGEYVLPGGKNYRELLLTLPSREAEATIPANVKIKYEGEGSFGVFEGGEWVGSYPTRAQATQAVEKRFGTTKDFKSKHWDEKNILAHVRFNDRTDAEGNKVLFIEELQSDWGQEGKKKGFGGLIVEKAGKWWNIKTQAGEIVDQQTTEARAQAVAAQMRATPSGPFVTKTEAWLDLGLKRMVAYAVENGYDKVAFVNGQQSAERYDLSKQVDVIYAGMAADGKYLIGADKGRERDIINKKVTKEELPDLVGKELAEKIINDVTDEDTNAEYRGLDLQVGGSGMKAFYDQIVPQRVREVLKKLGGEKAEMVSVNMDLNSGNQYKIVPRDDGQFALRGRVDPTSGWAPYGVYSTRELAQERIEELRGGTTRGKQLGFTITPAMREKVGQGMPLFSWARRFSDEEGKAATALMTYLAEDKAMFQVPISQAETLPEIVKEIDPAANIKDVSKWFDDGRTVWRLTLPKVGNRAADAYITERDGKVWINAASLEEGSDGNRIYAMIGNYAYNTGKVFIGDPEGITTAGMRRRAENMMSLALKFGTTDFIEPHEKMIKLLGMTWEKGNDQKNLQSLLNTTYNTNVSLTNGEIADVTFNFDDGKFYKNGNVFDDAAFARLAAGVRGTEGLDSAGAPGTRSLRVAALVNTVLSRADSAERGALLESVRAFRSKEVRLADSNNGGMDGPLHSLRYSRIRDAIDNTLAAVDHAVDGLSNLPNQFDYLKDRYLALGRIARVDEIIKEIRGAFDHVPQADKQAVYAYLTTRGASPTVIGNNEARAMAQRIKQTINYVGDALVQRGLLDPAARAHYRDQYLPRLYLKHLMSEQDWKVIGAGKKPTDMGYLKHRKDIAPEVRELILGEVKDPAFLSANAIGRAMRDVSLLDWMAKISQNNDWVFPDVFVNYRGKRVTAYWLKAEADRIERQIPHYEQGAQARARQLIDGMRQAANQALGNMSSVDHTKYKQIPDTHRYGLLRGMYVRTEIFNDIMGASQIVNADPTWFEDWFGFGGKGTKLTQWWKFSKVALNPPGQVRNFLSNMVMLQLSGVGLHKLPMRLVQAVREVANDGPHWKVAKKYGVTESTFTAQELFRVKRDLLAIEASAGSMNPLTWLRVASAKLLEGVSNMYQFSEALGKTIKIIDEMENGKSEAEAAIEAQKWLFDYSLVPQSIRVARNSPVGMPFITYQIKALPRLLEVAVKHPWRFLPWIGLFYGMQAYVASLFGVDEDELKKLKKSLPEWLQDRAHTVFLPVRDADGRLQVADVGYFFPWTFFSQTGTHLAEGNLKKAFVDDIGGQFSAPILGSAAALMANYNTFTHKPIYQESDPVQYKAAAIANYAYDLMAPPFISSHGFASPMGLADKQYGGKMVQAVTGTTNKFGDPKATEAQALAGLFGFNFYGMDPKHTRATNMQVMAKKVQDAELQLKYRLMDRGLSEEQRAKYVAAYRERMLELAEDVKKYAAESEVPDQLRVKK